MKPPRQPLFLARETYRKRRLMDAARLLPVVGAFLIAVPVLWARSEAPGADTAREAVYIFAVWGLLVLGAFVLSRSLAQTVDPDRRAGEVRPRAPSGNSADGEGGGNAAPDAQDGR